MRGRRACQIQNDPVADAAFDTESLLGQIAEAVALEAPSAVVGGW
jgi:hypothetical protein